MRASHAFVRSFFIAAVAATLSAPVHAAFQRDAEAVTPAAEAKLRQALNAKKSTVVSGLIIDGVEQSLELEPFDIYAPDAVNHVVGPSGERRETPQRVPMMRGRLAGDDSSRVFVSASNGGVDGIIISHDRTFVLETTRSGERRMILSEAVASQESATKSCDTEMLLTPAEHIANQLGATSISNQVIIPSAATVQAKKYSLRLAVDTDNELRAKFASAAALDTYIANLVGAVSTLYQGDLSTTIVLGDVYTYEAVSDPWAVTAAQGTTLALYELGNYWHANRAGIVRGTVAMLSGKSFGGGIGWIGTIGMNDFLCNAGECTSEGSGYGGGYSVNGSLTGSVNTSNKNLNTFWDVLEVAHEIGHNFNSQHTHCISATAYGRNFVDFCYTASGCYSGATSVPGELGTIMSYCHLLGGGYNNVRLIFGKTGEPSEAVLGPMNTKVVAVSPAGNVSSGAASVCANSTGNTASYSGAAGTVTYSWAIQNGTITSATNGSSVTYTAGASGTVTLTATVTSAKGISTIASVVVDITSNGLNSNSATVSAAAGTGNINVTSSCNWTAVSNSPFINITAGASGSGNGTVTYAYLVNTGAQRVGTITVAGQTFTLTQAAPLATVAPKGDFNGDSKTDLVLRNYSTGQDALWIMNGTSLSSIVDLPALPNTNYRIEGTADFNNDGKNDIVLRNYSTGQDALWIMDGTTLTSIVDLPALPNTNYRFEGTGDFNSDGKPDIILRNTATGQNALWVMNGTSLSTIVDLPALANLNFRIEGAGDFNNDGQTDIVLRNYSTGQNAVWLMNGTSLSGIVDLPALPNTNYRFDGVGDINNDGKPDIVLRNYSTGQNAVWLMNGTSLSSVADLPALPNLNYEINGPR